MVTFGSELKRVRVAHGRPTLERVGKMAGVKAGHMSMVEAGRRAPLVPRQVTAVLTGLGVRDPDERWGLHWLGVVGRGHLVVGDQLDDGDEGLVRELVARLWDAGVRDGREARDSYSDGGGSTGTDGQARAGDGGSTILRGEPASVGGSVALGGRGAGERVEEAPFRELTYEGVADADSRSGEAPKAAVSASFADDIEHGHGMIIEDFSMCLGYNGQNQLAGNAIGAAAVAVACDMSQEIDAAWAESQYPVARANLNIFPEELLYWCRSSPAYPLNVLGTVAAAVEVAGFHEVPRLELARHLRRMEGWQ